MFSFNLLKQVMITRKFILDQELYNYSNNELILNNAAKIISGLLPIRACSVLILLCILPPPTLPLLTGKGLFVFPLPRGVGIPGFTVVIKLSEAYSD